MKRFELKINIKPNCYYLVLRNPAYDSSTVDYIGYLYVKLPEDSKTEFGRIKVNKDFEVGRTIQHFKSFFTYVESLLNVYERASCYEGVFEFRSLTAVNKVLKKLNLIHKLKK